MAFIGSQEIILIVVMLLILFAAALPILFILYYVFRHVGRVRELEARVAELEKEQDRQTGRK